MHDLSAQNKSRASSSIGITRAVVIAAICAQVTAIVVLLFGDIGFMFPGRFGLTYGHAIFLMAVYAVSLLIGLIASLACRNWLLLTAQFAILAVAVVTQAIIEMPPPAVDAADFQHLVGQYRSTMETELGGTYMTSGWQSTPEGQFDFYGYNGLTVYVDCSTGTIDRITPNWRAERR